MTDSHCVSLISTGPLDVNTFLVSLGGPYVLVVDPAACRESGDEDKISSALKSKSCVPVAVILTHGHFDHVSGIRHLRDVWHDLPVLIHEDDAPYIGGSSLRMHEASLERIGFGAFLPALTNLPEPSAFLRHGKNLREIMEPLNAADFESFSGGLSEWTVIHTPGHTPGGCCLYNAERRILLSGDTVFFHSYGRTDLPGGNHKILMQSLRRIYSNLPGDTLVFPGHETVAFRLEENLNDF